MPIAGFAFSGGTAHADMEVPMKSKPVIITLALLFSVFLALALLAEISLRYGHDVLPLSLKNILSSKYNKRPDGIYYRDSRWCINILKPNVNQMVVYNDYRWQHRTNAIGIRDDQNITQANIVALGDSFIYGHGLSAKDTLCQQLEYVSNKRVANLGVQGDYPPSQYIRLKHLGLYLKPKIVLFFLNFPQDGSDFLIYRPTQSYIDTIVSDAPPDYTQPVNDSGYLNGYESYDVGWADALAYRSYAARLAIGLVRVYGGIVRSRLGSTGNKDEKMTQISLFMNTLLSDTQRLCNTRDAQLIVVFQANDEKDTEKWNVFSEKQWGKTIDFRAMNRTICANLGIPFLDLSERHPQKEYYLENDKHYSPKGNQWAANAVYAYLRENLFLR